MPYQQRRIAILYKLPHFAVNLRHQRASSVHDAQAFITALKSYIGRNAMRAEQHRRAVRHFLQLVDKQSTPTLEFLNDEAIMNDVVVNEDRSPELLQGPVQALDSHLHARTKSPRIG